MLWIIGGAAVVFLLLVIVMFALLGGGDGGDVPAEADTPTEVQDAPTPG